MDKAHEKEYRQLGRNIAYYRSIRKFTQEKFAEKAKISRTHLSLIESTGVGASLDVVFNIAKALEIDAAKLFETRE